MKLIPFLAILSAAVLPCLANLVKVTYDNTYDNAKWPLSQTACSNGAHGLETKYPMLGDIPKFPNVGGIPGLVWNSPLCGTCWKLTYTAPNGAVSAVTIFAVDEAFTFNIAEEAFKTLAGSSGVAAGSVEVVATQVTC